MIVRTDAVVLRAMDYSETSRIATLLTRHHGVIGAVAKGARRPTSRFGSTLQPGAYVQAVYYHRPNRGLQTLKEAAHLSRFPHTTADLGRATAAFRILEVARALLGEGEPHPPALEAVVRALTFVDASPELPANAVPWLQMKLATLLGFGPALTRDALDEVDDDGGVLEVETGQVWADPAEARGTTLRASRAALRAFAVMARTGLETAGRMRLEPHVRGEVEALADVYLRVHTDDTRPSRVQKVADQLDTP